MRQMAQHAQQIPQNMQVSEGGRHKEAGKREGGRDAFGIGLISPSPPLLGDRPSSHPRASARRLQWGS
jgi:hypothetical protein